MLSDNQNELLQQLLMSKEYREDSYFAKQLNVTERSIRNLLKSMAPYFLANQLTVDRHYGRGVRLDYTEGSVIEEDSFGHQTAPSYRRERIKLFLLLNRQHKTSLNALSDTFFVTKNAIVEDLKKIASELKTYHLVIVKNNQGTYLEGKRKNIKHAILAIAHRYGTEFIFNNSGDYQLINSIDQQIFTPDFSVKLRELLKKLMTVFPYRFSEDYYFSLLINLMIDSHLFGHMVEKKIQKNQLTNLGEWFKYEFQQVFGIGFKSTYNGGRLTEYLEAFEVVLSQNQPEEAWRYAEALVEFYGNIRRTRFEERGLIQQIALFISGYQRRQRYRIKVFNSQLDYLFKYYSEELLALRLGVDHLEISFAISIESNDELGSLLFYFISANEAFCQKEQLLVLSSHSLGLNLHLKRVLTEALPGVGIAVKASQTEGDFESYQSVIRYKKGRGKKLARDIDEVDIFNPLQVTEISQNYRQRSLVKEQEILQKKLVNRLIVEKMSRHLAQKDDILRHISTVLVDQQIVTANFEPLLIEKEVFNPVALTSQELGISVISNNQVIKSGFYAGFLPRTVQWTDKGIGQRVDSVFVLIVKEDDNQDLAVKNLYQGILHGLKESLAKSLKPF